MTNQKISVLTEEEYKTNIRESFKVLGYRAALKYISELAFADGELQKPASTNKKEEYLLVHERLKNLSKRLWRI